MSGFNRFNEKKREIEEKINKSLDLVGRFVKGEYQYRLEIGHHVVTGNLVGSITYKVLPAEKAVMVGTNVEYAAFVEYGTSRSRAYPCLRPAIDENRGRIQQLFKEVIGEKL